MHSIALPPVSQVTGQLTLPGSKSISNRALLLAALSHGNTILHDVLEADDTRYMINALTQLGVVIDTLPNASLRIHGTGGTFPVKQADLFLGNAGTAFRPLTAALSFMNGHYTLSGIPRMHERPIGDLVQALHQAGATIHYQHQEHYPPLSIAPAQPYQGQTIRVNGSVSSQFLTALLMALPLTGQQTTIQVKGELISKPYIAITLNLMARFGIKVDKISWNHFVIPAGQYYQSPGDYYVEGDASSASYFLAAGALAKGPVRVYGVGKNSIQGDIQFANALRTMGADITMGENWIEAACTRDKLKAIDLEANAIPDAAMTLAIAALAADGPSTLRHIASWRVKETDRLQAMATELRKVGALVEEGSDFIRITPPKNLQPNAQIDTYDDHRMAMCFSLISLRNTPIIINDPDCVRKTFPDYFATLEQLENR